MRVRVGDKEIAKCQAVVVAIVCAVAAVTVVLKESDRAKREYQQKKSYVEQHMALLSVGNATSSSNTEMIPAGMLEQAKLDLAHRKTQVEKMAAGFWVPLSDEAFLAVCVGASLSAAVIGYCASLAIFWVVMLAVIMMTRGIYHMIRRSFPVETSPYAVVNNQRTRGRDRHIVLQRHEPGPPINMFRGIGA